MATGLQGQSNPRVLTLRLLEAATATNSVPSGGSAGIALTGLPLGDKAPIDGASLLVYSTAGSGTMTVTIRLWGYHADGSVWVPLGPGGDTTKGTINEGAAIGETSTDVIRHAEPIDLPGHFSRLYAEITAIGGTSTAITVDLVVNAVVQN